MRQLELFGPNYKPEWVVYCYSCGRSFFWHYAQKKKACPYCLMSWEWKGFKDVGREDSCHDQGR